MNPKFSVLAVQCKWTARLSGQFAYHEKKLCGFLHLLMIAVDCFGLSLRIYYCQTIRVFGPLMQIRVFLLCFVKHLPLEGSTISARNLEVSLPVRDTPAPVEQYPMRHIR
jgi:hypothetical protein